jgi:glycosyltransferase involved in cell wall biosynthesis
MRVLIISPYPPDRCGIASYVVQVAATLRQRGHSVDVVSPQPSAAQYSANYSRSARGVLRALALSRQADRTLVEFFPDLLFKSMRRNRFVLQWAAVALLLRFGRRVDLVVHEAPYGNLIGRTDPRGRIARAMWRTLLTLPHATFVHTAWERQQLVQATGVAPDRIQLLEHGESFIERTQLDRGRARRELGLREGDFHFLSIGFLQPHKGFDRAMRALAMLQSGRVRLDVVGSMRVHTPEVEAHVDLLRRLADTIPGVTLHEAYVSDEVFDRWIVACDAVVLPYREIWSSGVLARAKLYGRPAIVSDVGGLSDQGDHSTRVVHDDAELCAAMAELAGVPRRGPAAPPDAARIPLPHGEALLLMRRRADALRQQYEPGTAAPDVVGHAGVPALPRPLVLTPPPAGRGPRERVKRLVDRLTRWELMPVVAQINEIREYLAWHERVGKDAGTDAVPVETETETGTRGTHVVSPR